MDEITATTKAAIEAIIAKPKMTTKLLTKPPFRFLHDTIMAIMAATGFGDGLYGDDEKDSGTIKDKAAKVAFLNKMISCVGIGLGEALDVRPAKIVAGAEAENTNAFLQALARAAQDSNIDSAQAVERALGGEAPGSGPAAVKGGGGGGGESKQSKEDADEGKAAEEEAAAAAAAAARQAKKEAARKKREDDKRRAAEAAEAEDKRKVAEEEEKPVAAAPPASSSGSGGVGGGMSADVAAKVAAADGDPATTKAALEALISKPKPSTKLLGKPPFRFLHDIVCEMLKATGFGEGVYAPEELDSANVKDKASKMTFLQKMVDAVGAHLGCTVEARPAKIVAGLEADLTNKWLQLLCIAASSPAAGGGGGGGGEAATPERAAAKSEGEPRQRRPRKGDDEDDGGSKGGGGGGGAEPAAAKAAAPAKAVAPKEEEAEPSFQVEEEKGGDSSAAAQSKPARPTTARRKPPRLQENVREVERSVATAVEPVAAPVNIMMDGQGDESEDEDEPQMGLGAKGEAPASGGRTKLVKDILDEEKAAADKREEETGKKGSEEGGGGIRLGRVTAKGRGHKKGYGFTDGEISQLRTAIQTLCQSTNPLGKCMDYVHDDLESMNKELDLWRSEYRKKCELLEEESKGTEEALQALQLQLVEVDEQVKEQVQKINGVKASIAKNDVRIQQLLRMLVVPSSYK